MGSASQSLGFIPGIEQPSSTKTAASAIAKRHFARELANIAKHLTNPFMVAVSPKWNFLPNFDRRTYLLPSGVPMAGDATPLKRCEVVEIRVGEGHFERKQFPDWAVKKKCRIVMSRQELRYREGMLVESRRSGGQGRYSDVRALTYMITKVR